MDNRQKQARYRERQRALGMVQVTEWVPAGDAALYRQIAADLRAGKRPGAAPPSPPSPAAPLRPEGASPHSRPDYPPAIRTMALRLTDSGVAPVEVRRQIKDACGRSPDGKNWSKLVRSWREWAAKGGQGDGADDGDRGREEWREGEKG